MILVIETSCDETSAAVVDNGEILSNALFSQIKHHKIYGGVMPELASRLHAESIDRIIQQALMDANVQLKDIKSIAVTVGPGLEGALLVGITAANTLASQLACPLIPVNHLHGHIYSASTQLNNAPFIACIASGGHTMLVLVKAPNDMRIITNTKDDACGEAFDKVARMLYLDYPGGPAIEQLSLSGINNIELPHPVKKDLSSFSFSGLKTAMRQLIRSEQYAAEDLACSFQSKVAEILSLKMVQVLQKYDINQCVLCGGVFSNEFIRLHLLNTLQDVNCMFPNKNLCTDNAGMIGLAAEQYEAVGIPTQTFANCNTRLGVSIP
tara:strand:- start:891 stop:1862 length:972 start_codon:yes stop_codon:yes gene_type:complete